MCGILGSISDTFSFSKAGLDLLSHRGPDDEGIFTEGNVMFGHRRLSIVDLSSNGHQPMFSVDENYVLIYNGEIYNHLEIRNDLQQKGYTFRSGADTETLLYGFCEYGTALLKMLNGIFAFAIYDKKSKKIFLVRDQFGIKPLYYYHTNTGFAFASEMKAFQAIPGFEKEIDHTALFYYLQTLYAPGDLTPFKKVRKLLPGHFIEFDLPTSKYVVEKYFEIQFNEPEKNITETDWKNALEVKLLNAVDRQLMSDVPIGYFLSVGLDSSLIVALAKKLNPSDKLNCFTIAGGQKMKNEGFADDEYYARKVAAQLGVQLHVHQTESSVLNDFDQFIWHLDEPQADPAPFHVYTIAKSAREMDIKVLLGGTAGDDIFSGYRRHQALYMERYIKHIPGVIGKSVKALTANFSSANPTIRRIKKLTEDLDKQQDDRFASYFMWAKQEKIMSLFSDHWQNQLKAEILPTQYFKNLLAQLPPQTANLNKMLFLELNTFLPDHNLNYTDKMSMAASVETRVPYLDTELVNFVNSMPAELKMKGKTTKYLLRKVAENYLSKEIIYRPKTGFGSPIRHWVKYEMKTMIAERLSPSEINKKGIFDAESIQQLITDNSAGKIDASYTIWSLLAIDSWITQFANNE